MCHIVGFLPVHSVVIQLLSHLLLPQGLLQASHIYLQHIPVAVLQDSLAQCIIPLHVMCVVAAEYAALMVFLGTVDKDSTLKHEILRLLAENRSQ